MIRALAVLAASSAVLMTSSAVPAVAAVTQSAEFVGFTASATTLTYQQPVTFTGELTDLRTRAPLAGEPVQIQLKPPGRTAYVPVAAGTTGDDGTFSITTTLPSGGYVEAAFAGDAVRGATQTAAKLLHVKHVPSRFVLDPIPASVPSGTPVTFSGTVQVQVDGDWQPFAGAPIELIMEPDTSTQSNVRYATISGADGGFSLTEPVTGTSRWTVTEELDFTYFTDWFPDSTDADYGLIQGVSKTRVTGFTLPSRDEAHHAYYPGMYAGGTVERWNGTAWVGLTYGWVDFYYRPKGSTSWHRDYTAQTDAYGDFRNIVGVHLGTADWQARVRTAADTLASTSGTVTNTITDQTHFATASVSHSSSKSYVNGQVTDWSKSQPNTFSTLKGLKVHLYYRAHGSKTWHSYKTGTLATSGRFALTATKGKSYSFKVVFPTQGAYQTSTSKTL
ncbi:hypothetical protein GCM10027176_04000 [Actinoallomurus bryophytorum]|uniref:Carboxypeptidase family protein n=2 Tax=Actinoallomurus bryophytorum TaxID=1490222 RepID=A0A543CJR0_9ACTN|nr:hypothetical protein FB559_2908 [Actinoallomurus bryophytorum]